MDKTIERVDVIINRLMFMDKMIHFFIMKCIIRYQNSVGTASICYDKKINKIVITINPKFVESLTDAELGFVLTHEIYHLLFRHIYRRPAIASEKKLFNVAADLSINSVIEPHAICQIPKSALLPVQYNLPPRLTMDQYIILLRQNNNSFGFFDFDKHEWADNPPSEFDKRKWADNPPSEFDKHEWADNPPSEDEKEIIDTLIDVLIDEANKANIWGDKAGDIRELIIAAQRCKVPWYKKLRYIIQGIQYKSTSKVYSSKVPSRRYGWIHPGTVPQYTGKLLVAIDVSGSISNPEISQFVAEVNSIVRDHAVSCITFDAEIQNIYNNWRKVKQIEITGRGGTNFQPVLDYASKNRYSTVVIFTDGIAPAVEKPKCIKNVIWVLTPGNKPPVDYGTVIHL